MSETPNSPPELYLIAHKVRGQPAFDIATQIQIGDELGWIIPTSGHRARPYWRMELEQALDQFIIPSPPPDWPDHYAINAAPREEPLAARLGILPAAPPKIARRV